MVEVFEEAVTFARKLLAGGGVVFGEPYAWKAARGRRLAVEGVRTSSAMKPALSTTPSLEVRMAVLRPGGGRKNRGLHWPGGRS